MKKLLLLFLILAGLAQTKSSAQMCDPDLTLVDSVVGLNYLFPPPFDTTTMMGGFEDTTCIGVYFETVLHFVIPTEIEFNGVLLPVTNIEITGVNGMPVGLNYACTPSDCDFRPAQEVACVLVYGIATDANAEGDYELGIEGTANIGFSVPLSTLIAAGSGGKYFLYVRDVTNATCTGVATENLLAEAVSIRNTPNPFSHLTDIEISSTVSGDFDFRVLNTLGATVHSEQLRIDEGRNTITYDGSDLAEGVYFYSISNRLGRLTGKLIVSR